MIADPVCSIFIALLIAMSVWSLVSESVKILMQRQPVELDHSLPEAFDKVGIKKRAQYIFCAKNYKAQYIFVPKIARHNTFLCQKLQGTIHFCAKNYKAQYIFVPKITRHKKIKCFFEGL